MSLAEKNQTRNMYVLHMDDSPESLAIADALTLAKVSFRKAFASTSLAPLPAIETPSGILCGIGDIKRYLLPDLEIKR